MEKVTRGDRMRRDREVSAAAKKIRETFTALGAHSAAAKQQGEHSKPRVGVSGTPTGWDKAQPRRQD